MAAVVSALERLVAIKEHLTDEQFERAKEQVLAPAAATPAVAAASADPEPGRAAVVAVRVKRELLGAQDLADLGAPPQPKKRRAAPKASTAPPPPSPAVTPPHVAGSVW